MEYDNNNSGVLFKNDKKETDKHPDYKGNVEVDHVAYWLAAWIKEGKSGKFMSLSLTPKDAKPAESEQPAVEDDDNIPF